MKGGLTSKPELFSSVVILQVSSEDWPLVRKTNTHTNYALIAN